MRVALFHNRYSQRGGEDAAFDREVDLLRKVGCEVHVLTVENSGVRSPLDGLRTAARARGNPRMGERVAAFLARHPVDLGHVHNFFPLLTTAVHETLFRLGLPVVQTMHNYRLACAHGGFLRAGRNCEECVVRGPWHAVRHGCWRGSRLATAVWADATATQRRRGTWQRVDRFIAPSPFARSKLVEAGLPAERIDVVPDAVDDPGEPRPLGRGAVYVGRLSPEKGVGLLLEAWRALPDVPLTLVGTGPEEAALRARAEGLPWVRFTGALEPGAVAAELAGAAFLVAPSLCYETFGLAAAEALAAGRPVVVPRRTALADLVEEGRNGLLFEPGDTASLVEACRQLASDPSRCALLGAEARAGFEEDLAPMRRTRALLDVYRGVLEASA